MRHVLAATAILLTIASPVRAQEKEIQRTVSVTGQAETTARPDRAHVGIGVETEADTASAALEQNSAEMRKIIEGIKAEGVEAKDIQTSDLSIQPVHTRPQEGERAEIEGYRAANNVQITVRDLAKLGDILDSVVALGANRIGGVSFSVSDADARLDGAREEAVADARRKAELLAQAAGAKLGQVVTIVDNAFVPPPRPYAGRAMAMEAAAPPIETGEETLSVTVQVTWELE